MHTIRLALQRWWRQARGAGAPVGQESGPERRPAGAGAEAGAVATGEVTVDNRDIRATWYYHDGTKHPHGYLMDPRHTFDPATQPLLFKRYIGPERVPLPLDLSSSGVPALEAIRVTPAPAGTARIPSLDILARLLYFSAGITKRIRYRGPVGEFPFRAAACTGALYHIELYVICGDLPGLRAGVYHFDPERMALDRLRQGDYRRALIDATGSEPAIARAPAVIAYTDVFWRNACKYQEREYRHAFWDSGTIVANSLAISSAHGLPARVVVGFVDAAVNRLLDLDTRREVALLLAPVGYDPEADPPPPPQIEPLALPTVPISERERDFPAIRAMHAASSLTETAEVAAWRASALSIPVPAPSGPLYPLQPHLPEELPGEPVEQVILRRGSARHFSRESIDLRQFATILDRALRPVPADYLEPGGTALNHLYLIVNALDELPAGAYVFHRDRRELELLAEGDFRREAGMLALHQELAADASVALFFLSELDRVLERLGNRGYRAAQLDASIAAGRVYLAAEALHLAASGLTFYDDAVTEFFSPHAEGKSAMFLIAVGKRARRV